MVLRPIKYRTIDGAAVDSPMQRRLLRVTALIGAAGSAGLTLYAGRHNSSRILMALFVFWVLSPFVGLVLAEVVSKRWTILTSPTLLGLVLVIAAGSLAIYGYVALGPPRAHTAFVFVVVPPASWLLIAVAVIAAIAAGRRSHHSGSKP